MPRRYVEFYLTSDELKLLKLYCRREKLKIGTFISKLIKSYFESEKITLDDIKPKYRKPQKGFINRNKAIFESFLSGKTYSELAKIYGLSRPRINEIIQRQEGIE